MDHIEQSLSKLSKDDTARLVLDYQGKFDSVLKTVKDDICEMKTKFKTLESEFHVSKTVTDNLTKYIKTSERKCYENEQYTRRECLEISGILGNINDNALEETVLGLLSKYYTLVDPSNVEDCHRLKSTNNAPQKVIIKLSKQKDMYRVLKAKPSLKNVNLNGTGTPPGTPIFVNQSLCSWSKCKRLWLNKVVESFWVPKGLCRMSLLDYSLQSRL